MSTRCWRGTEEQMCNHLLVSNKGAPSSPLLFSIYLSDVDGLAEGMQPGRNHGHSQFYSDPPADDLSLTSTDHNELQIMLNNLRVYAQN